MTKMNKIFSIQTRNEMVSIYNKASWQKSPYLSLGELCKTFWLIILKDYHLVFKHELRKC